MLQYLDLFGGTLRPTRSGFLKRAFDWARDFPNSEELKGVLPVHFYLAVSNQFVDNPNYLNDELYLVYLNIMYMIINSLVYKKICYEMGVFRHNGISHRTHCITTQPTNEQRSDLTMRAKARDISESVLLLTGFNALISGAGLLAYCMYGHEISELIAVLGGTGLLNDNYQLLRLYKRAADGVYAIIEGPSQEVMLRSLREPGRQGRPGNTAPQLG